MCPHVSMRVGNVVTCPTGRFFKVSNTKIKIRTPKSPLVLKKRLQQKLNAINVIKKHYHKDIMVTKISRYPKKLAQCPNKDWRVPLLCHVYHRHIYQIYMRLILKLFNTKNCMKLVVWYRIVRSFVMHMLRQI